MSRLFSGERVNPSRDALITLTFAGMALTIPDAEEILFAAGYRSLVLREQGRVGGRAPLACGTGEIGDIGLAHEILRWRRTNRRRLRSTCRCRSHLDRRESFEDSEPIDVRIAHSIDRIRSWRSVVGPGGLEPPTNGLKGS